MGTGYTRVATITTSAEVRVSCDYARMNNLSVHEVEQVVKAAVRDALAKLDDVTVYDVTTSSEETGP